jgi:hypothetical protein
VSPYGNFGIAADEAKQELFLSIQHNAAVMVFRKGSTLAPGDHAIRLLQGNRRDHPWHRDVRATRAWPPSLGKRTRRLSPSGRSKDRTPD